MPYKNREARLAWNRKYNQRYYLEHKETFKERNRKHYQEHKEYRLEQNKKYNQEHRASANARFRKYRKTKNGRAQRLATDYRTLDKKNGVGESTLTKQWILENIFSGQVCYWCGEGDWLKLGCDRIDNKKPHTPDNVVCSCWSCNSKRKRKSFVVFKMLNTPTTLEIKYPENCEKKTG